MTEVTPDYRSLSLAGIVQTATMVHHTALGGMVKTADRQVLLNAVLTHNARDLGEIFPEPYAYADGAGQAVEMLSGRISSPEVLRYTMQLTELARRLRADRNAVRRLAGLLNELGVTEPEPVKLSIIYQQTISTLGKRIQVVGEPSVLQQEATADIIRAMLLAGVRFGWLWQQLGGRRWHLIVRRKTLLEAMQHLDLKQR
ncbi:MAG: DUF489 family protein [Gammaproteobacteria bacterium]|nr:DUF489 family protein [Gammaproteobacteria bacterium]